MSERFLASEQSDLAADSQSERRVILQEYDLICKLRSLWAVIRKEVTIFIRYPSWVVAVVIWPVLFPLVYIFNGKAFAGPDNAGVSTFANLTGTGDYIGFMALGSLLYMWINMVLWSFGNFLRNEQLRGTLESTWLTPMPRIIMLIGAGIGDCLQQCAVFSISLLEFYLILNIRLVGDPLLVLAVILLTIPTIYGVGFLFASLVVWAKEVNVMVFLVRGMVMIFCGISYPLAVLPDWMQSISRFIPMTYAIRAFRNAYLTDGGLGAIKDDLLILAAFGIGLFTIGYFAFIMVEKSVRGKGNLGVY